ncbi:helix-turn-helix domain-containing protein [Nocardia gamkensis]|uniref:PucR family transcriptional regulator n=1 Tax=Nocardia gamkensis TaxID=352869 RepID=UPI00340AEE49
MADRMSWVGSLMPSDDKALGRSALSPQRLSMIAERIGRGPAGWAVELGEGMARQIIDEIPPLNIDVVAHEVRRGCEAVALAVVAALAEDNGPRIDVPSDVLAGPAELVSRGVRIEHMLRSVQVGHSYATTAVLQAVERVVPADLRFAEMRRVSTLIFGVVDEVAAVMAREFGKVQAAWTASSAAARIELVQDILRGTPVPLAAAARTLDYDLTRQHTALVVWADDAAVLTRGELERTAAEFSSSVGHTSSLILPVGARRVWAWGSRVRSGPETPFPAPPAEAAVRVAVGLPAMGVAGFTASHEQAVEAARFGMLSRSGRRLFAYADVDLLAMLSTRVDIAREFVLRELGDLAGSNEATATVRQTLKCYLDVERSLSTAAERLHVARNTVAYRVQRAEQLRGLPIDVRRMQLQAALSLAEELGDVVLGSDD